MQVAARQRPAAVHGAGQLGGAGGGLRAGAARRGGADGRPPRSVAAVALEMEREFHGTPSGVDHTTWRQGQLISYRRQRRRGARVRKVYEPPAAEGAGGAGGRAERDQGDGGGAPRCGASAGRCATGGCSSRSARWLREGTEAVEGGDLEALGDAMNVNHGLLCGAAALVAGDRGCMVHRLRLMGALGAKLTGAGGDGGRGARPVPRARAGGGAAQARGLALLRQPARGAARPVSDTKAEPPPSPTRTSPW